MTQIVIGGVKGGGLTYLAALHILGSSRCPLAGAILMVLVMNGHAGMREEGWKGEDA